MSKVKTSTEASPDEQSSTAVEASSDEQDDSFSPLMQRLESAIHRLKLAADDLSYLAEKMPAEEHGSAAFVVQEVTRDLNLLYRDLNFWEKTHNYTPRDRQHIMEHLRQIGADDDARNRMLHGRTVLSPSVCPGWETKEVQS
jgi:hypothetical protein